MTKIYRFGPFSLEVSARQLSKGGIPLEITPKVFDTLQLLVEQRHRVVPKDEAIRRLWPGRIVEEANLTQNIYTLRRLLNEQRDEERYIKTVSRIGYRFIAAVREGSADGPDSGVREMDGATGSPLQTLGLLPITSAEGSSEIDYLCSGVTEHLFDQLAVLPDLRLAARARRRIEVPVEVLAQTMGVDGLLMGEMLEQRGRIRLAMKLIDARSRIPVWRAEYDRPAADLLKVPHEIVDDLSRHLWKKAWGDGGTRGRQRQTTNTEAYDLYARGRYLLNKRLPQSLIRAIEYFHAALDADPQYAQAYVGLADSYALLTLYGGVGTPAETFPQSKAAAERALAVDPKMPEAHTALGVVKMFFEWDWAGARDSFVRAIDLDPGCADAHFRLGSLLVTQGKFDEAEKQLGRAHELDPLSLIIGTHLGYPAYFSRDYDRAIVQYRKTLESDPKFAMAHFRMGLALVQLGRYEEAVAELGVSEVLANREKDVVAVLGYIAGVTGAIEEAEALLRELETRARTEFATGYNFALVYIGLGRPELALRHLEEAFHQRSYWLIYSRSDPLLDSLRGTAQFQDLLARMGLAAA